MRRRSMQAKRQNGARNRCPRGTWIVGTWIAGTLFAWFIMSGAAAAQSLPTGQSLPTAQSLPTGQGGGGGPDWSETLRQFSEPAAFSATLKTVAALTVLSLAPAVLLMTTSFVRIAVVLGLLRQAIGAQWLPSNQIITSLAMFLTLLVMTPVWTQIYDEVIVPYTSEATQMSAETAWQTGIQPVRRFMSQQIEKAQNSDDVWLFMNYLPEPVTEPKTYDDVPFQALLPAFMLSELKVAFLIGFRIFLPFLIIDLVVASVSTSMGMMMLPPTMVSLPMKLLLFVLVDGWHLVVGMLLESFAL